MIRSLRRKFILIAMASLIGTMAVLCAAIGFGSRYTTTRRVDKAISILYQNGGGLPPARPSGGPLGLQFPGHAGDRL